MVSGGDELITRWKETKVFRTRCVEDAIEATRESGEIGLQHGKLMDEVGQRLGLPKRYEVHDVAKDLLGKAGASEKEAVRQFVRGGFGSATYTVEREYFMQGKIFPTMNHLLVWWQRGICRQGKQRRR